MVLDAQEFIESTDQDSNDSPVDRPEPEGDNDLNENNHQARLEGLIASMADVDREQERLNDLLNHRIGERLLQNDLDPSQLNENEDFEDENDDSFGEGLKFSDYFSIFKLLIFNFFLYFLQNTTN